MSITVKIFADPNLGEYALRGWDVHKIITGRIRTISSHTTTYTVSPATTVQKLKEMIEDKEGVNKDTMCLRTTARTLRNEETIKSIACGLTEVTVVMIAGGATGVGVTAPVNEGGMPNDPTMAQRPTGTVTQTVTVTPEEDDATSRGVSTSTSSQQQQHPPSGGRVLSSGSSSRAVGGGDDLRAKMAAAAEARMRR
eukprot:PhF_6_TR21898/c0_g1_i1/m.31095